MMDIVLLDGGMDRELIHRFADKQPNRARTPAPPRR
jgi:hypothetical protein